MSVEGSRAAQERTRIYRMVFEELLTLPELIAEVDGLSFSTLRCHLAGLSHGEFHLVGSAPGRPVLDLCFSEMMYIDCPSLMTEARLRSARSEETQRVLEQLPPYLLEREPSDALAPGVEDFQPKHAIIECAEGSFHVLALWVILAEGVPSRLRWSPDRRRQSPIWPGGPPLKDV